MPRPPPRFSSGLAHPGEHLGQPLEALQLEDLRADVRVQAVQLEPGVGAGRHRARHVVEAETELRVLLAGLDVRVRRGLDPGSDPQQHASAAPAQPLDLVERVHHYVSHTDLERVVELGLALVVAVEVDPPRLEAARERQVQLPAAGHVGGQPLFDEQAVSRGAGKRLARVDHLEALDPRPEGLDVGARPGAHVVLGVHVGGRTELARELDHVAAADLEPALLVQARAQGIYVRDRTTPARLWRSHEHPVPAPPRWKTSRVSPTPCSCPRASRGRAS